MNDTKPQSDWTVAHDLGKSDPMEWLGERYKSFIRLEKLFTYLPGILNSYRRKWWKETFYILWFMNGQCELSEHISLMQEKNRLYSNEQLIFGGSEGLALRSLDKICRIKTMTKGKMESASEPLTDSMMDLMNYSILANIMIRGGLE